MFKKIKIIDLSDNDLNHIIQTLTRFLNTESNIKMLDERFEKRYQSFYKDDTRRAYVYNWFSKHDIKLAKFYTFIPSLVPELDVQILKKIFGDNVILDRIAIQVVTNGNLFLPHIDQNARKTVLNFPISNFEHSFTSFYSIRDTSLNDAKMFTFDEITEIARFTYEKNSLYQFNAGIPHSVSTTHSGYRIMLSYGIS